LVTGGATTPAGHAELAILLIGRALLASLFPALRAPAIDPIAAIREEWFFPGRLG
jgi:ABC-type lipoprotein release transport system permease subunit